MKTYSNKNTHKIWKGGKKSLVVERTWNASVISHQATVPLTDHDSQRWNRNFYIKQEHKGELTFDQMSVCSFDKEICIKRIYAGHLQEKLTPSM